MDWPVCWLVGLPVGWLVGLAYPWTRVRALVAAASLAICTPLLHRAIRGARGVLPIRMEGAISQMDLPALTSLSVAGYSRLQLGAPNWATLAYYCK